MLKRTLVSGLLLAATLALPAQTDTLNYIISPQSPRQPIEGWGVSLCWWARMCGQWSEEKVDSLVDWMVSPQGLNWNIFRYNIGGGDDPQNAHCEPHHMGKGKGLRAEMEGFQDYAGGPMHWERDAAQRRIMLKIKERRPDAIFEAFSNSAPWWMTVSGCVGGHQDANTDNLDPAHYENFAHYLVEVCKHYRDVYGMEFKTLEPFNEPVTNYWYAGGSQEGCHFSMEEQVRFVRVIEPILKASGLNTVLACSDETDTEQSVRTLRHYQSQGAMPLVGQWNTHTYGATHRSRSQVGTLARAEGKTIWMDEVGAGGQGLKGNLELCQKMFHDLHYILPAAWIDWQYVEEHNDQWCLVRGQFADESTARRIPNYYVRQQVTRFIKQGYTMVSALSHQAIAALSPARDTLVISLLNASDSEKLHLLTIPGLKKRGKVEAWHTSEDSMMQPLDASLFRFGKDKLTLMLPPLSLYTLVIPIKPLIETSPTSELAEGEYLIVPQSNCEAALTATPDGGVCIQPHRPSSKAQRWMVRRTEHGYSLTSANGQRIADAGAYLLASPKAKGPGQSFGLWAVDDYFYRITSSDARAFDLQGEHLTPGTAVGLYTDHRDPGYDTRNWHFVRIGK